MQEATTYVSPPPPLPPSPADLCLLLSLLQQLLVLVPGLDQLLRKGMLGVRQALLIRLHGLLPCLP